MQMSITNPLLSLAILAIVLPLNIATPKLTTTTCNTINPFCNATENKRLCTTIVDGATTWPSATANAISSTLRIVKQGKPMLADLVKELQDIGVSRISKESIGYTCNEIYDFAVECLQGTLDDLKYGYMDRLATKLSSVTGPSSECTDEVRKLGIDSRLSNFFSKLELHARICLSITRSV